MAENDPKTRSGGEAGRPRVSRDQRETVGRVTVDNPRMVCRSVDVYYGDKQAIKNVSVNPDLILMDEPCSALDPIAT